MYAIIKTGGKQYRVSEGDRLQVEKLDGDAGATVTLADVLLVGGNGSARIGTPFIEGAQVEAEITRHFKGKKIIVFKKKRRKGYHKKQGHRQLYTELKITRITG